MINGLTYIPNFITDSQQDYIINDIDSKIWSNELKRRVQHYGYKYDYTYKNINESMKVQNLTNWMVLYGNILVQKNIFTKTPDQVIINEYIPGQGISKHIDCKPCFENLIASLSLLSGCIMEFTCLKTREMKELYLEPKSLLVIKEEARYEWFHGIPARKKDGELSRNRRVSITFRNVILQT